MGIPVLISDLAVMMLTAGVITVLFKKIKQPLVLGYILAGFLLSRYFPMFVTVNAVEEIETWSEIGIIFLMFHLGLEFNLHTLAKEGGTAVISTIVEVIGMVLVGCLVGTLLGFTTADSVVLGGMLSMSSTMVIIKVFDEINISDKKLTGMVFGTLVIQDIVGIFMMVILSMLAVSKNISGISALGNLGMMFIYLIVWLILGIYLIPTILDKTVKFMNDEMLVVVSVGICLGNVLLAEWLGFSSSLGAFLSGSLLAGTLHVERIEHLTKGLKDLFGAVFFLSVGMMVDPEMIVKYIVPIAVITVATIIGKIIFGSLGMLVSGQNLGHSITSGFSLTQIGEFAFIIAALGRNLGIIGDYLYPIIVSVSVITIFTTPYCIKAAPFAVKFVETKLPKPLLTLISRYTEGTLGDQEDSEWNTYIKRYFLRTAIFGGLMFIVATFSVHALEPLLENVIPTIAAKIIATVLIYAVLLIFSRPFLNLHNNLFTSLWLKRRIYRLPLIAMNVIKIVLMVFIATMPLQAFFHVHVILVTVLIVLVLYFCMRSGFMAGMYLQLETRFLRNFNERLIAKEEEEGGRQAWLDEELRIISFYAQEGNDFVDEKIQSYNWGSRHNLYIVKIERGGKHYLLPKPSMAVHEGDKVYVIGELRAIENFYAMSGIETSPHIRTLKEFMATDYPNIDNSLSVLAIKIRGDEMFAGRSIKQSNLRSALNCMILGLQKNGYPIIMPDPNMILRKGDILWLMGANNSIGSLAAEYLEDLQ